MREIYPIVEFNQVDYSKKYLDHVLDDYLNTYNSDEEDIFSAHVDIKLNKVVIEVDEDAFRLKSRTNYALPIIFKVGSAPIPTATKTIYSGETVTNKKSGSIMDLLLYCDFSVGIGAKYNGKNAMVACGHSMAVGDKIYSGLTHIGTVSHVSYSEGCLGDFSIITMEGDNIADGQSKDGSVTFVNHGILITPEIGTIVIKYTDYVGFAAAKITVTNDVIELPVNDTYKIHVKGQTRAKIISGSNEPGDSGGGVFHKYRNGQYYFCGIMSAKDLITKEMIFTPSWIITMECDPVCV